MRQTIAAKGLNFGILAGENIVTQVFRWVKDEEVDKCHKCQVKFSTLTRRHHCRECGSIFCDKLSKMR
ncbi:MAG: FYVE zinc finger domain-containing protein, partial [bacterium]